MAHSSRAALVALLSAFCWAAQVAGDAAPSLRGSGGSPETSPGVVAAGVGGPDVRWAHEWLSPHITGNASVARRSIRSRFGKRSGVAFCQYYPDGAIQSNNLAARFEDRETAGWSSVSASKLSAISTIDTVKIVKMENRAKDTDGPDMTFSGLAPGSYQVTGWAKLDETATGHSFLRTAIRRPGQKIEEGEIVATGLAKKECWTKVTGGFTLTETSNVTLHVGGPPANTNLMVASYAVTPVNSTTWRAEQDARIDQFRKRSVTLQLRDKTGKELRAYLKMDQTESEFPFGAAVSGAFIQDRKYQKWFSKRFNWAVYVNEAKWYAHERWKGDKNYGESDNLTTILESYGINIRGHAVLWDVPQYVQGWVKKLSQAELREAVDRRVQSVVERYKGRFKHWDVNNEMLHGGYFKTALNDSNFAANVFKTVKAIDPDVKAFVNDYNVVEEYRDSDATPETMLADVYDIQSRGGQVDSIGVQGHFTIIDGPRIKAELDALATAGLPIWFTELDINGALNESLVQADRFETVMREAFSHPSVEGIVQWDVGRRPCSQWMNPDKSLCSKPCGRCLMDENYVDRPIGKKYVRLRKEWSTHFKGWNRSSGNLYFRGFFGKYRARIMYRGKLYERFFYVPKGTSKFTVTIKLDV